ncbi:MAG TPA: hypothetical protein VGY66_04965 [Gemmataceae bacterium]|nr:hypothetical protein [Gemmataceae bacterium]
MNRTPWFQRRPAGRRPAPSTRLSLEHLEDRTMMSAAPGIPRDILLVGDGNDNSVKRFDADTGTFLGNTVAPGSGGLNGPRGLIFRNPAQLLVVDQNLNEPNPGEILRFNAPGGDFLGNVVSQTDANAPFAPRGMVLGANHILYVGDDGNLDGITLGRLARFNSETGAFLGDLQPSGFTGDFYPRGVVIGPDGMVYASVRNIAATGGEIMRWNPATGQFLGDFVDSNAGNDLNRPEGIAFGPDGNLYVASFRADASDTDKVLEFSGKTGAYIGKIDLDQVGQPRAFGQALLFGPDGKLFVPITGTGPDTGAVRRYDVSTGTFDDFVPASASGGPLGMPWYLTFGDTNPGTLDYADHPGNGSGRNSGQAGEPLATATVWAGQQAEGALADNSGLAGNGRQATSGVVASPTGNSAVGLTPAPAASTMTQDYYFAQRHEKAPAAELVDIWA